MDGTNSSNIAQHTLSAQSSAAQKLCLNTANSDTVPFKEKRKKPTADKKVFFGCFVYLDIVSDNAERGVDHLLTIQAEKSALPGRSFPPDVIINPR